MDIPGSARAPAEHGYAAWNGPFELLEPGIGDSGALRLALQQHHLNSGDRMHGGLVMGMMSLVLKHAATRCQPVEDGSELLLSSLQLDCVDAARAGEVVEGRARPSRGSRTLVFVGGELTAGGRTVATGSAVFRRMPGPGPGPGPGPRPPPTADADAGPAHAAGAALHPPPGHAAFPLQTPFSNHAGPVFARTGGDTAECALRILPRHLEVDGNLAADGAALLLADLALGRCARQAAGGRRCVTVSLQLARHGGARLGELLVARPRHQGSSVDLQTVAADFFVGPVAVMSALGTWKVLPD